ncbi:MAG: hypothetical protein IJV93_13140 [Lentisphaeria bacterium]|nr:hypothetical protein [Lentisphaeria bacterium]
MKTLCSLTDADGQFVASEELRKELASINKWLDGQTFFTIFQNNTGKCI